MAENLGTVPARLADEEAVLVASDLRVDVREGRLWRAGIEAPLPGKPFAILVELMASPQQLVTKDELFARVWDGRAVSDAVLTTAIRQLRQALGEDARAPDFIETVHGRGYRFLKPVERVGPAPHATASVTVPAPDRKPRLSLPMLWLFAVGLSALLLLFLWAGGAHTSPAHPKSVAILPLADLTPGGDRDWFAEGMTEEIVATLSRTPDIQIASRKAAADLAARGLEPREVGRTLNVAHIVEGSVREDGERVRVSIRLTRTADRVQVWAQNFDKQRADIIEIQQTIAFDIAQSLKTVLDPDRLRAMLDAGARSPEAYDAYLEALAFNTRSLRDGSIDDARRAADAIERARLLDPDFALAHWLAAQRWFVNSTQVDASAVGAELSPAEQLANYFARVDAAIASAPNETEALKYRAARAAMRLQLRPAYGLLRQYLGQRPRDIDAWDQFATLAAYVGDSGGMELGARRVHDLSMEAGAPLSRAITISAMAMDVDSAEKRAREQLAINPDNALTNYQAHRAFIWSGRFDEARPALEAVRTSSIRPANKQLAEIRQACAEGRLDDAKNFRKKIDQDADISTRWQAAKLLGDDAGARALLAPLDNAEGLPELIQFLFQPTFEPRDFPALMARLEIEGVEPRPAVETPSRCRA